MLPLKTRWILPRNFRVMEERKRGAPQEIFKDDFARELESAVEKARGVL